MGSQKLDMDCVNNMDYGIIIPEAASRLSTLARPLIFKVLGQYEWEFPYYKYTYRHVGYKIPLTYLFLALARLEVSQPHILRDHSLAFGQAIYFNSAIIDTHNVTYLGKVYNFLTNHVDSNIEINRYEYYGLVIVFK